MYFRGSNSRCVNSKAGHTRDELVGVLHDCMKHPRKAAIVRLRYGTPGCSSPQTLGVTYSIIATDLVSYHCVAVEQHKYPPQFEYGYTASRLADFVVLLYYGHLTWFEPYFQ